MIKKQINKYKAIKLTLFFAACILFMPQIKADTWSGKTTSDNSKIIKVTAANYTKATEEGLVLVDFWAPWCGPCRVMSPILERLATDYEGKITVAKLNVDQNQAFAKKLGISAIPVIIVHKDGKELGRITGVVSEDDLRKTIDELL